MSLNLDKNGWKRVRMGDVVRRSRKQVDPLEAGVERYVAGGDIDGDSITISRWSDVNDGQMGSTFRYVFEPGQVLFVSARPYLRKFGVVDFAGVVADKTYVLDAIPENGLLHDFLPFVLSSNSFVDFATTEATGSMNPRLLWGSFQRYEFDLPPLEEQKRIANLLWAIERHRLEVVSSRQRANGLLAKVRSEMFDDAADGVMANEVFDITIGRQRSPKHEAGDHIVHYLRSANVTLGRVDVSDVKSMNFEPKKQAKFALSVGDVLVSEASASAPSVGMPAAWNAELPGVVCFQNTLLRYRAIAGVTLPAFVEQYCFWAFETRQFLAAASGTNIRHIGVGGATSMRLRRPSLEEQRAFVVETSATQASVRALESESLALKFLSTALMAEIFGDN